MDLMPCKNVFDAKMYLVQKCIFAPNLFLQSVHLTLLYIFLWKMLQMHFCKASGNFIFDQMFKPFFLFAKCLQSLSFYEVKTKFSEGKQNLDFVNT